MCSWRLMRVVLQCQNQDGLRSALWGPATYQDLAGSRPPKSPRSVFRQELLPTVTTHPWNLKCCAATVDSVFATVEHDIVAILVVVNHANAEIRLIEAMTPTSTTTDRGVRSRGFSGAT